MVSEKTLEINFVRNFQHSYHFVWQGATLREEAGPGGGWDVRVDKLASGKSFIVQFKRPYSIKKSNDCKCFTFYINNNTHHDQNQLLSDLAQSFDTPTVFYAFPCVEEMSQLAKPREEILWRTALADVKQTNLVNLGGKTQHKIEIDLCPDRHGRYTFSGKVYSEQKKIDLMTVSEYKTWGFELNGSEKRNFKVKEELKSKRLQINFFTKVSQL